MPSLVKPSVTSSQLATCAGVLLVAEIHVKEELSAAVARNSELSVFMAFSFQREERMHLTCIHAGETSRPAC